MKKLAKLTKATVLTRAQQKSINGGDPPCFEWCACPDLRADFPHMYCNCSNGGGSGNGGSGNGSSGNGDWV